MDPSQEIIPQRVNHEKKPGVDEEKQRHSPRSISKEISKVLDIDDLLFEILLRLGLPTTLVRASLVCRRWLHHTSDPAFLHRFRELHPPHLLGFYVNQGAPQVAPCFVPMLPQSPELTTIIHRASSILDTDQRKGASTYVLGCRNGYVMILHREEGSRPIVRVHNLLFPERGKSNIIPCKQPQLPSSSIIFGDILSKEEEGFGLSYLFVLLVHSTMEGKQTAHVYKLQDGVLCIHNWTIYQIPYLLPQRKSVLIGNKIFIAAAQCDIIVLDLMASSFFTIQLPKGVEHGMRNTMLARPDDADGIYLAHVKGHRLCMWLHKVGDWLLVDTICLREVCASLSMLDSIGSLKIKHVGDNAEFVFLEMGRCALFWDVKRKTVYKVYEMPKEDQCLGNISPFMMIWPPTFPAFKDDRARNKTKGEAWMDDIYVGTKTS